MMADICIPGVQEAVETVHLVEWVAQDGKAVKVGDLLYTVENDKSGIEIEAAASGILQILEPAGRSFKPGHLVGHIR